MSDPTPAAFFSYAHFDDEHELGRLSDLRERLSGEVRVTTGHPFRIFQDREDISWGEAWESRLGRALDEATFLIAIITPGFLRSDWCRAELTRFNEIEDELGRQDLILPIHYVDTPDLRPGAGRHDDLVDVILEHQMVDWRELRFEPHDSGRVRRKLNELALGVRDALNRGEVRSRPSPPHGQPGDTGTASSTATPAVARDHSQTPPAPAAPASHNEPPTLSVDPLHRGDHATISEAIEAAAPGTRILVRPGFYEEGLVITKPLEILGDGDRSDIVVQAAGADVVLFQTTMGRVANLTLRQTGGEGQWYAVDITQGRLELEGCDISSQSLATVAIRNGADPRVRNNRICQGSQSGVSVYADGRGTVEDNDISANANTGIRISERADPTIRNNQIHHNQESGIYVYEDAAGTIEDNDINNNTNSGIQVSDRANPTIRNNQIHHEHSGIYVYEDGLGTIEGNDISANAKSGIHISERGDPTIRDNRIHHNEQAGILVHEDGLGTIEGNDISANALAGIEIRDRSAPVVRENQIHHGLQGGVYVHEDGLGTIEGNEIRDNTFEGVGVRSGGNPTVRRNTITGNGYEAVWIRPGGAGTFANNDLTGNGRGAWDIEEGAGEIVDEDNIIDD